MAGLHHRRILWVLCLLAFAARVAGLGGPPLSGDEAFSVLLAERSWHHLLITLRTTEPNPPLHFVLLKLWMVLAGRGEFAVRFPSAAAGTLAVPLTYVLGRRLLGTFTGLVAALLVAVNPYLIWYDHFARAYSLYLVLTLGSWVVLLRTAYCVLRTPYCVLRTGSSERRYRQSGLNHGRKWTLRWAKVSGASPFRIGGEALRRAQGKLCGDPDRRSYSPGSPGFLTLWLAYVVVTTLALYTHYFAFLLFVVQAFTFLPLLFRNQGTAYAAHSTQYAARNTQYAVRNTQHAIRSTPLTAQATVLLLFTPWLLLVAPMLLGHKKPWLTYTPPPQALWRTLRAFSLGMPPYSAYAPWLALLFGAVLIGGVVATWRRCPLAAWVLTGYLFGPLLAVLAISLLRPVFLERYLIATVPAFLVLLAAGLVALCGEDGNRPFVPLLRHASFAALLVLVLLVAATATPYGVEIADWRGVARALAQRVMPQDVVVQNYPDPAFAYYYAGPAEALVLPASVPVDRSATDVQLRKLLATHRRLWLIPHRDPTWDADGFVERWLELRARRVVEEQVAGHRVLAYEAAPVPVPTMDARLDWRLGDLVRLVGYTLEPKVVCPGDRLTLTLFWAPLRSTDVSYTVFVHLWDGQTIWGQKDGPPQAGRFPTTDWFPGDLIADRREIPVDPATPSGAYRLIAGLYRLETGERLPVYDPEGRPRGDAVPIATVKVGCRGS